MKKFKFKWLVITYHWHTGWWARKTKKEKEWSGSTKHHSPSMCFGRITFLGFFLCSPSSSSFFFLLLLLLLLSSFFFFSIFYAQLSLCHFFFFSFLSFCLLLNGLMGSRHMIRIFNTLLHSFSLLVLRAHQLAHQLTQWCNKSLKLKKFQLFYILFIYFINT